jgi:hypothetical protein
MILPGITRQSVLDLAKEWDEFRVEERNFTMDELIELNKNNKVSKLSYIKIYTILRKIAFIFIAKTVLTQIKLRRYLKSEKK